MIRRLDHVGIAVKSLESVKTLFKEIFRLEPDFEEIVAEQKVKIAGYRLGESTVEFMEPVADDSPISRFLEKRGEGLHHIAFAVSDMMELLNRFQEKNLPVIDQKPRVGVEGKKIAFLHPRSTFGVLIELVEEQK